MLPLHYNYIIACYSFYSITIVLLRVPAVYHI